MTIRNATWRLTLLICACGISFSCAGTAPPEFSPGGGPISDPAVFFRFLDAAVDEAGVENASVVRISGFPYLRGNRFSEAMKDRVVTPGAQQAWIAYLRASDRTARRKEIQNLPDAHLSRMMEKIGPAAEPDREALYERAAEYGDMLLVRDRKEKDFHERVRHALKVPSEYSPLLQFLGGYPLAVIPVALATWNVQRKFTRFHAAAPEELPVRGKLVHFMPQETGPVPSRSEIRGYFSEAPRDELGLPILSERRTEQIVSAFAPVFVQDVAADYDRIGRIFRNGDEVGVDPRHPTVYHHVSHGFFKGSPALRIIYVIWYSARSGPHAPWYEHGRLDGLTFRVSLDPEGNPFMLDVMNNCGCYHFFAPEKRRVERIQPVHGGPAPFVPAWLPSEFPEKRLHARINSGRHQVENLGSGDTPIEATGYRLVPYDILESLPGADEKRASVFDASGIARGSERIEPIIFFPMGVPEVGAMRQRGHHAITFLGRAHFDEPDLFDRRFEFTKENPIPTPIGWKGGS